MFRRRTDPSKPRSRQGLMVFAISVWGLAFVFFNLAFDTGLLDLTDHVYGYSFELASFILGIILAIVVLSWMYVTKRADFFEFPVWFSLNAYVQLVLNVWLLQPDIEIQSPWLRGSALERSTTDSVILIGVSLGVVWVSYTLMLRFLERKRRYVSEPQSNTTRTPRLAVVLAVWAVATVIDYWSALSGNAGFLSGGGLSTLTNYLAVIGEFGSIAAFVLMITYLRQPRAWSLAWLIFAITAETLSILIIGSKTFIFFGILFVMAYYYARRNFPWRLAMVAVLAAMPLITIVNQYRTGLREATPGTFGFGIEQRIGILGEAVATVFNELSFEDIFEDNQTLFEGRQGGTLEVIASIVAAHNGPLSFLGEELPETIFESAIPRVLWSNKPIGKSSVYNSIGILYLGWPSERTGVEISLFGDAYRWAGWLGVAGFFTLVGIVGAWFYYWGARRGLLMMLTLYSTIIVIRLLYSISMLEYFIVFIQYFPVWWLGLYYVMFKKTPTKALPNRGREVITPIKTPSLQMKTGQM